MVSPPIHHVKIGTFKGFKFYSSNTAFFYLDPPYYDIKCYQHNLDHKDQERLRDILRGIKGNFILSFNDHPEVRKLYKGFPIEETKVRYTLPKILRSGFKELIIQNF